MGRIGRGPEATLFDRYNERLRPRLAVVEIAEGRGSAGEIKRREADAILAAVAGPFRVVALDLGAACPDSATFAARLAAWSEAARPLAFVIGGAEGLDARVMARADHTLSLGALTWPHMLVRVLLAEQLYRAGTIAAGHPYHRAGRP